MANSRPAPVNIGGPAGLVSDIRAIAFSMEDPFGVDGASSGIRQFLEEQGGHPAENVEIRSWREDHTDRFHLAVICGVCDRTWRLEVDINLLARLSPSEIMRDNIVPFFGKVSRTTCFRFTMAAELAEWITTRLAEAGARGTRYSELVREAIASKLCTASDIDLMLNRLGFKPDTTLVRAYMRDDHVAAPWELLGSDPYLRLPKGHPLAAADWPEAAKCDAWPECCCPECPNDLEEDENE